MNVFRFRCCTWCSTWFRCCAFWSCFDHIRIQRRTYTYNLCRFTIFRCNIQRTRWLVIFLVIRSRFCRLCFHRYRAHWFHNYVHRNRRWCCTVFRCPIFYITWVVIFIAHFHVRITFTIRVCIRATYIQRACIHICESHIILRSVCNFTICILFHSQVIACYHFYSIAWSN